MGLQHYTQDMSRIPLKYYTSILFYTQYTHPTLICRGRTDGRTHGHKFFTQYSGISSCSQGSMYMNHLTCYTFSFTSTKQNTLNIKTDIKNTTNSLLINSFIKRSYNQHSTKTTKTVPMMTMMTIMYKMFQQVTNINFQYLRG